MKVLSDILHKAGILKEAAEAYSSGGYSVLVRNSTTQRLETVPSSSLVPSQTGNAGKYLTTDGSNLSWGTVSTINIYTDNGTLTAERTVSSGGFPLIFTGSNTAVSATAKAVSYNHTLVATANNDALVAVDINPTYTLGTFTTPYKYGLRTAGLWVNHSAYNAVNSQPQIFLGNSDTTIFSVHGGITGSSGTTQLFMRGNNPGLGLWYFTLQSDYDVTFTAGPYINNMYFKMGNAAAITIKNSGNVIIGTGVSDTTFKLDVQGALSIRMPSYNSSGFQLLNADGVADWQFYNNGNTSASGRPALVLPRWSTGTPISIGAGSTSGANFAIRIGGEIGLNNNSISIGTPAGSVGANSVVIGSNVHNSGARSTQIGNTPYAIGNIFRVAHDDVFAIGNVYQYYTTANGQGILNATAIYIGRPARSASGSGDVSQGTATSINGNGGYGIADATGGDLIINGGIGLGAGTPGDIIFGTATPTTSGTTIQSLTNRARIKAGTGQLILNAYTSTSSFTGIVAGYLAFDSSGNIITVVAPSGGGGGTVTSVSGSGSVSGLSLSGTVTSSGSLTLSGSLVLTSLNITTGLGYTPYNSSNPSGFISSNIYTSNGTLSGNRTVTMAGNYINFDGGNVGIGASPAAINSLQVSTPNQWSGAFIGNMGGARTPSAAYGIHLGWNYTTSGEANILWGTGEGSFPYLTFSSWDGIAKVDRMVLGDTGKLTLKQYLSTTSFTGTPVGYIAFDSTGGLITVPIPTGSGPSVTLSAIGSSPNVNGASLTGSVLNLEPASASFGGIVTTGAQAFAGAKTFGSTIGINGVSDNINSGEYIPTITGLVNLTVSGINYSIARWMRIGNVVSVTGRIYLTRTAANTESSLNISLPTSADILLSGQISGVINGYGTGYGNVIGDPTNNNAYAFFFSTTNLFLQDFSYHFSYIIN